MVSVRNQSGRPLWFLTVLETWWQGLGQRLQARQERLAVPDAPEAIAALAGEWWARALDSAPTRLQASLAAD